MHLFSGYVDKNRLSWNISVCLKRLVKAHRDYGHLEVIILRLFWVHLHSCLLGFFSHNCELLPCGSHWTVSGTGSLAGHTVKLLLTVQWFLAWWHNSLKLTPASAFFILPSVFRCMLDQFTEEEWSVSLEQWRASISESVILDCYCINRLQLWSDTWSDALCLLLLLFSLEYLLLLLRMNFHMLCIFPHEPIYSLCNLMYMVFKVSLTPSHTQVAESITMLN